MHVVVGGAREVQNLAWGWPTAIISAVDGPESFLPECNVPVERLVLYFRDTTDSSDPTAFTSRHAEQLLGFVDRLCSSSDPQRVIVHCGGGMGRSPALAYALLAIAYGESAAIEELQRIRPQADPNPLVVRMVDRQQSPRGPLWNTFEDVAHGVGWLPDGFPRLSAMPFDDGLRLLRQVRPKVRS